MSTSPLIKADRLKLGYGGVAILQDVTFEIHAREYVGIIGPNGGGKTTLLRTLLGLLPPVAGRLVVAGDDKARLGYVPQRETFDALFPLTAFEVVLMGRYGLIGPGRWPKAADRRRVDELLALMGVTDFRHRPFRDLSGGQKQRVLIARALAGEPAILVLDEPTASMDVRGEGEVMSLLERQRSEHGVTIVMVSHFLANLRGRVQRVLVCDAEGRGFWTAAPDEVLTASALGQIFSGNDVATVLDGKHA